MKLAIGLAAVFALGLASSACGDEDINFAVKYAPGYSNSGNAISIFGVFKDGRMSPEAWDDLGPRFSAAFHDTSCDIAISSDLRRSNLALFTAVDDAGRQTGITDVLLDRFGPAAVGTSVLVITISGRVPKAKDATHSATRSQMMRGGSGGRGRRSPAPHNPGRKSDSEVFEISGSLFSIAQHRSVAQVAMLYKGTSEEEALTKFVAKLGASFPGASCRGWKPDALPTDDTIRRLPTE